MSRIGDPKVRAYIHDMILEIEKDESKSENWRVNEAAQAAQSAVKVKKPKRKPKGDDSDGNE